MNDAELEAWFAANKTRLEDGYTEAEQPWQQSGFGIRSARTATDWEALRRPIAASMSHSGTWLDIGCANGYLIECVLRWTLERDLQIEPYGLDFSAKLIALAQERLPEHESHFYCGNAWSWSPPRRFDYVSTELVYVPEVLQRDYLQRLLNEFVTPHGSLLVVEYRTTKEADSPSSFDARLAALGLTGSAMQCGILHGKEMTRVLAVNPT